MQKEVEIKILELLLSSIPSNIEEAENMAQSNGIDIEVLIESWGYHAMNIQYPNDFTRKTIYHPETIDDNVPPLPISVEHFGCSFGASIKLPILSPNLKTLECEWNNLTSLPLLPPNLVELNCSYNPLKELPQIPLSLKHLCISNNLATLLPSNFRETHPDCEVSIV